MRYSLKYTLLTWGFLFSSASATTINVPDEYSTIQAALTAADSGDTVLVQPGTYYEIIYWPDVNGIKLTSEGDSSNTIIDGSGIGLPDPLGLGRVIYMNFSTATIDSTTEIRGFKITGGATTGGGIQVINSGVKIIDCLIAENGGGYSPSSGGLYCSSSYLILDGVTIRNNMGTEGGGLKIAQSDAIIRNCIINNNEATSDGGGAFLEHQLGDSIVFLNTIISSNTAYWLGGGIYAVGEGTIILSDVLIMANNQTVDGTAGGGGIYCDNWRIISNNTQVVGNIGGTGGGICVSSLSSGDWPISGLSLFNNQARLDGGGIALRSNVPISSCTFFSNASNEKGDGIYIYSDSPGPVISNCNFQNNGTGIFNGNSSYVLHSDSNWWGHSSGPYAQYYNPTGLGDTKPVGL